MKVLRWCSFLFCLSLSISLVACDPAVDPTVVSELRLGPWTPPLSTHLGQLTLYVAPEQRACQGEARQRCLLVKEKPEHDWQYFYDPIQGFAYEPGFTYRLLVGVTHIESPPADGSSIEWRLVALLDKIPAR